MTNSDVTQIDGRRARRERGRLAAIDATVDLISEGHVPPSAEAIAERAGISMASLYRYFSTIDALHHQTTTRFLERYADLFDVAELGEGPVDDRVRRLVDARTELYDTIAPIARLARSRSLDHPHLAGNLHDMRHRLAEQVRAHFAPELEGFDADAADDLVLVVATVTSFESWDQLAHDFERTPADVRRAWTAAITALLSGD